MTKLEQKLCELGYRTHQYDYNNVAFYKISNHFNLTIETNGYVTCVFMGYVDLEGMTINTQQQLDNLQQAFNQLQQDLEVLKEC